MLSTLWLSNVSRQTERAIRLSPQQPELHFDIQLSFTLLILKFSTLVDFITCLWIFLFSSIMEAERKYMDKRAEAMTKKCFDGLFQIWEKMGSENLRKDKVDYILKNFEDILEIYVIIEKKNMEKMKKNIQELHLRRRELHKDLGKIIK